MLKNSKLIYGAMLLAIVQSTADAATASVAGTRWNLTGKFAGKASVKCKKGGSHAAPFAKPGQLSGAMTFVGDGDSEGRFIWADSQLFPRQVEGNWTQKGSKLELEFDHWHDSPLATFGFAMGLAPATTVSQGGATGSFNGFEPTKISLTGSVASNGKKLALAEKIGFKFDASGSYGGNSNSCSFVFDFSRSYSGAPQS